jgi:hypothetical protein
MLQEEEVSKSASVVVRGYECVNFKKRNFLEAPEVDRMNMTRLTGMY